MERETDTRRPRAEPTGESRVVHFVSGFGRTVRAFAVLAFWLIVAAASLAGITIALRAIWWAFETTTRTFGI